VVNFQIRISIFRRTLADIRIEPGRKSGLLFWLRLINDCVAMPRETAKARAARAKKILAGLRKAYPDAHCELNYAKPLELLIATILSAQCTDKRVNLVTADLFKKYRSAKDCANADPAGLEQGIKTTGFFPEQSEEYSNLLPQTRRASSRSSIADDGGIDAQAGLNCQVRECRSGP
jgi:hypothetical protein